MQLFPELFFLLLHPLRTIRIETAMVDEITRSCVAVRVLLGLSVHHRLTNPKPRYQRGTLSCAGVHKTYPLMFGERIFSRGSYVSPSLLFWRPWLQLRLPFYPSQLQLARPLPHLRCFPQRKPPLSLSERGQSKNHAVTIDRWNAKFLFTQGVGSTTSLPRAFLVRRSLGCL